MLPFGYPFTHRHHPKSISKKKRRLRKSGAELFFISVSSFVPLSPYASCILFSLLLFIYIITNYYYYASMHQSSHSSFSFSCSRTKRKKRIDRMERKENWQRTSFTVMDCLCCMWTACQCAPFPFHWATLCHATG